MKRYFIYSSLGWLATAAMFFFCFWVMNYFEAKHFPWYGFPTVCLCFAGTALSGIFSVTMTDVAFDLWHEKGGWRR